MSSRPLGEAFSAVLNAGSNYYKLLLFNFVLKLWHTRQNAECVRAERDGA